jgi:AcrR family transcriptional regulator
MSIRCCMVDQRLGRQDWVDAALKSLAKLGHQSLRAERLAVQLGVSRGSFYWHFEDVEAFQKAVLDQWEIVAVGSPYSRATKDKHQKAAGALSNLIRLAFRASVDLERAVRSWAAISPLAAKSLARVDQHRVDLLAALVSSSGVPPNQSHTTAVILYLTYLGHVATAGALTSEETVATLINQFCNPLEGGHRDIDVGHER